MTDSIEVFRIYLLRKSILFVITESLNDVAKQSSKWKKEYLYRVAKSTRSPAIPQKLLVLQFLEENIFSRSDQEILMEITFKFLKRTQERERATISTKE
ncbi:hypothetical protein FQR65_LT04135 [Abscondita terminalis]|nr:hypothetical protein FQR65_LT04135 [Abscondita terminalis]